MGSCYRQNEGFWYASRRLRGMKIRVSRFGVVILAGAYLYSFALATFAQSLHAGEELFLRACNLNYAQIHGSRRSRLPNRAAVGHPNGDVLKARRSEESASNKAPGKLLRSPVKIAFSVQC